MPPNSSSDGAADAPDSATEQQAGVGLKALVKRLAEEFSADPQTLVRVASIFRDVRERAPDLFVPGAGALATAFGAAEAAGRVDPDPIYTALGEWALDAEGEPIERMRRDCLRFQSAMMRGAMRLNAADAEKCTESLLALQRFNFLQIALLASLSARSQAEGG